MKRLWFRLRKTISDIRELNAVEKGIKAGDEAALETVRGWGFASYERRCVSQYRLVHAPLDYGLFFAFIPLLFLVRGNELAFYLVGVGFFLAAYFGQKIPRKPVTSLGRSLLLDSHQINAELLDPEPGSYRRIEELLADEEKMREFQLTDAAEKALRTSLSRYLNGSADLIFLSESSSELQVRLLSEYGREAESGVLLRRLARAKGYPFSKPMIQPRIQSAADRFSARMASA